MDFIKEANSLAKKSLNSRCLSLFKEARLIGIGKDKKLVFFFKNYAGIAFFERDKEALLKRLRIEFKKQKALYDKENFIFYGVLARNAYEIKHRDAESEAILEKGIARLKDLLAKKGKKDAIPA